MYFATANGAKDSSNVGIGMMHLIGVSSAARAECINGKVAAAAATLRNSRRRILCGEEMLKIRPRLAASVSASFDARLGFAAARARRGRTLRMALKKLPHPERDPGLEPGEQSKDARRRSRSLHRRFVENLLWGHRHDLGVGWHKMAALDQLHEFRLDLARDEFSDLAVLVDVAPFADQIKMIGVVGVAAQHAVFCLRRRAVEWVVVAVIEFVEQLDEFVAPAGLHPEIVDMEVVALRRQRYQRPLSLPQADGRLTGSLRIQRPSRRPSRRTISCRTMPSSDNRISTAKTPGTSRLKFKVVIR